MLPDRYEMVLSTPPTLMVRVGEPVTRTVSLKLTLISTLSPILKALSVPPEGMMTELTVEELVSTVVLVHVVVAAELEPPAVLVVTKPLNI